MMLSTQRNATTLVKLFGRTKYIDIHIKRKRFVGLHYSKKMTEANKKKKMSVWKNTKQRPIRAPHHFDDRYRRIIDQSSLFTHKEL